MPAPGSRPYNLSVTTRLAPFLALVFLLLSANARAQETATAPATSTAPAATATAPASQPATAPATQPDFPIPLGDVVTQSESIKAELRATEADLANNPLIETIDAQLAGLAAEITARRADTTQLLAANPSLELISSEESNWQTLADTLASWKRDLASRGAALEKREADLEHQLEIWRQMSAAADRSDVLKDVKPQIKATLDAIAKTRTDTADGESTLLGLQARVAPQSDAVAAELDALREAREQVIRHLFVRDGTPIWGIRFGGNPTRTSRNTWSTQVDALLDYLPRETDHFLLQGVMLAFFVAGLYWARSRFNSWLASEPTLAAARLCSIPRGRSRWSFP